MRTNYLSSHAVTFFDSELELVKFVSDCGLHLLEIDRSLLAVKWKF